MNLPMKIFNYGSQQYILYKDMILFDDNNPQGKKLNIKIIKRNQRNIFLPYEIIINNNKKLIDYIDFIYTYYYETFKRFINLYTKKIPLNNGIVVLEGYEINGSFLSYLIQGKDKIYNFFEEEKKIIEINFFVNDFFKKFNFKNDESKLVEQYLTSIKDGIYHIEVKDMKKNKIVTKQFVVRNHIIYYNDNACLVVKNGRKTRGLQIFKRKKINYYDDFVKLLKRFFESINVSNNENFDEYIKTEVYKLMSMDFDIELKKLQEKCIKK
jgi:ribosomal protein L14